MAVVLLGGGYGDERHLSDVMQAGNAIPFLKFPHIMVADGFIGLHLAISPQSLPDLKAAATAAGMYVLSDRFSRKRQGALKPGANFTI